MSTPFERVLLPIAEETDAETTCEAIEPYLGPESAIVVVHVIEQTKGGPDKAPVGARKEQAEAVFGRVRDRLGEEYDVRTELRYGPDVIEEILGAANDADATAIGFTPRPGGRWVKLLSGDHVHRLTNETDLPVLAFPHPEMKTPARADVDPSASETHQVLVPIDGSRASREALEHACSVYPESEITVLHVPESAGSDGTSRESEADPIFEEAREVADEHGVDLSTLTLGGNVPDAILDAVEENDVDLIVMGREGRSGLRERLFGSVTESVVHRAPVPVTVVR